MTTETGSPDPQLFHSTRGAWATEFVRSLVLDTPVPAPEPVKQIGGGAVSTLRSAAKREGKLLAFRTFGGRVWVSWIGNIATTNGAHNGD